MVDPKLIEDALIDHLDVNHDLEPGALDTLDAMGIRVRTFEEAGVMTTNRGLVIELDDGSEFQITIVKSR